MRTAKNIMTAAFQEALKIVRENGNLTGDPGSTNIAASNLAMAIFSYEAEMEAMNEASEQISKNTLEDIN